jgi:diguanylate cyclase (GGDEF)-like protein
LFYARPGWESDYLAISVGNALRMVAIGGLWTGMRVFYERRPLVWVLAATGILWVVLCLTTGIAQSMLLRVVGVSLVNGLFCFLAAYEIWRGRGEALPSRVALMATFCSFGTLMLLRTVFAGVTPFPFGVLPLDPIWLGGFMFAAFAHSVFAAFLFISMIRERREATQRNFAMSDPLTGLMNRRAFIAYAERSARRRSTQQSVSLLVLDIDHFKSINDRFGHETGDKMLAVFAATAEASVRPADQLFRMGGEEFCFVLPDTPLHSAIQVAERIRANFELSEVPSAGGAARTTVSVGIAATEHSVDLQVLHAAADAAVYEAKARGRNRVVVAAPGALLRAPSPEEQRPERRLRA